MTTERDIDQLLVDRVQHGDKKAFELLVSKYQRKLMRLVSRLVRASLLDEFSMDYVRVGRAMGLRERTVVNQHALRNALLPTITIVAFTFAFLLTGAVLTETVFSWPGVGSYAVDASRNLDYPAIIGVTLLGGTAFLVTNLLSDIAYAFADPRIRLS